MLGFVLGRALKGFVREEKESIMLSVGVTRKVGLEGGPSSWGCFVEAGSHVAQVGFQFNMQPRMTLRFFFPFKDLGFSYVHMCVRFMHMSVLTRPEVGVRSPRATAGGELPNVDFGC